ncbi:hypothetical protein [Terriglobus saanensis]|uniref:Uncharacterized protein n=1 Tax=Terriglobus saanensis (strain ATCC BAA-1853 / DSM 23119 / SP1PR4) TaxID=401053 RepID=E8V034_TERSS|nr:hypothetical protein [Terriglobus saanensis]ADV82189.1 hypothetical protein AciPR4_1365 [Terriglobus saanensis SP1PR4]
MYRQVGGSAIFFVLLSALISNVGGVGHGVEKSKLPVGSEQSASSTSAIPVDALEADTHRCSAAEVLRRHLGRAEKMVTVAPEKDNGIVCSDFAFQDLGAVKADANEHQNAIPQNLKTTGLDLTCSPNADKENKGHRCRVLIATLPDPLQSANLLEFDRDLEALQEAVSTAGYDFESMYTPWNLADLEEPKDPKGSREAMHYRRLFGDEPGAMLFHGRPAPDGAQNSPVPRMGSELLMLLLVPESPTYGLNMHAAVEALSAIDQLKSSFNFSTDFSPSTKDGIFWIGPNYSASAAGLYHLAKVKDAQPFYAISGSITSERAISLLKAVRTLKADKSSSTNSTEDVTTAPSDRASLEYLLESGLIGEGKRAPVAVLQENESAYGSEDIHLKPSHEGPEIRTFRYPRGISHVRGLFGKQLTNFKPQNAEAPTAQDSKSLFDFTDALQQPLDSPPEFAAQSPYSNEGVLAAIATSVEHIGAKAIVILATDPLDQLFLARYFHQKVPNARVVLLSAERLLPELRGQYDLDGTLSVSRFPLFDDAFLYAPTVGQSRHSLSFMNSTQEGIFLAALQQIAPLQVFEDEKSHALEKLSLWIGVSSHGSYWPVHRAPPAALPGEHSLRNSYAITNIPEDPLPKLWLIATSIALVCAAVHVFLFLVGGPFHARWRASDRGWIKGFSRHRVLTFYLADNVDASDPSQWRRELGRQYWLLSASTQIVLVLAWLVLPAIVFVSSHDKDPSIPHKLETFLRATDFGVSPFGIVALVILLAACVPCLWLTFSFYLRRFGGTFDMPFWRFVWLPLLSLLWLVFNLVVLFHELADGTVGSLFALRCVHLASGASPLLPLLLASAGLLTAAAVNLNALTLARDRDPQVPLLPPGLGVDAGTMDLCRKRLTDRIECWGFLPPPEGLVLLLGVLLACAVLHPFLLFSSIDGQWMTMLYGYTFITALWTIAWLWVRFIAIWKLLRFLLELLEGSPMRFAFSRLPKVFSLAPIWSYAGLRRTLILPMRWFEYRKVAPRVVTPERAVDQIAGEAKFIDRIVSGLGSDEMLLDRVYVEFSEDQNRYATLLLRHPVLKATWQRGGPDIDTDRASEGSSDPGKATKQLSSVCRDDLPVPCGTSFPSPCEVAVANEYIAMRFGAYVRYVTLQLKNLMTFMSMGLFLLLVAAVSYPFQEPQNIAWSLIVIVAILLFGIGTVLLQMDRDSILSRMSETPPGEVKRGAFLLHMLSVGGLPVLTALSAVFPSMGNVLFSWIQPMLTALH